MSMSIAHARQHVQHHRIAQGTHSGELTRDERRELRAQQREIRAEIRDARSDGEVTAEERAQIQALQNEASRSIYDAKHDDERATETKRADRRQERQAERIQDGIDDGSLTEEEAATLQADLQAIEDAEAAAKSDGVVSLDERRELEALQDQLSRAIYAARHDETTPA
ncbi:hypothetical protein L6R52_20640 [Myxococcota bacterium]|nr:hypothetical protein [Myxococcota bacterium]